ncbi:sulfite reductase (ferredoxin) [Streptosporangium becharense]|uniref:assimilatory sulfite reductase (ferredoxin) n=1 Tax=Streptosporangium becharense TaxID=1816182 RepID=A0A7W9MJD8_9ACTN|nr:nitrite/sulfite reductase [Streptosporangium becharense]MBB2911763.1 sulfite reductase (ferredoxin) [Streptosporangium becharense]MBB5822419.1 sulfite reductase (ferredoxin) [Streptosporangium becharense]
MTTPARPASRHHKRPRGEGQWALGYREPLNKNEENKKNDDGLNVRQRIIDIYSKNGFDSIDPADLRGRMRWYGLYTQRKPGIDGGKTAVLDPEELDDRYFMLRVRIDGGRLTVRQLRVIAEISNLYGRGTADVTDRQNIQLHWIEIEAVPDIWARLEAVGLSTTEACGDTPRVILGCPLAGIDADEVIDGTAGIREIHDTYIGDPAYSNLPRKFKAAVSGCPAHCTVHEINDVAFVGVVNDKGERGFDLWVGGGLSTNPMLAKRLGVFLTPEQVAPAYGGVIGIFRDYGYRRLRHRARIKFLVNDWGVERFREILETEYLGYALPDGPAPELPRGGRRDHVGVFPQKDGNFYVGFAPKVGRLDGDKLHLIADIAERHGSDRVHTTVEQKMVILDVAPDRVDSLVAELEANDLRVNPSTFRRQTMACTGIEFCKLAIVETKATASDLIDELEQRLPDFKHPLTINVNGCPNSCARIQVADIGLKGQLVVDDAGEQVEGFQIHLGGSLGVNAGFGRKVRGLKTTAQDLPDYVERVLRNFDKQKDEEETFSEWVQRADEADLK